MDIKPAPPPAAALLRLARKAAGLSVSEAARQASASMPRGISTARWSQIENGYEIRAGGHIHPVEAEAGMLAHMAGIVGVSPERLETEGQRPDAAEIVREIARRQPLAVVPPPAYDIPLLTEKLEKKIAGKIAEVGRWVKLARLRYPEGTLAGQQVFPLNPDDARLWDLAASAGWGDEGTTVATAVLLDDARGESGQRRIARPPG